MIKMTKTEKKDSTTNEKVFGRSQFTIVCRECKEEDSIRSDERVHATYRVSACATDEIDYDGTTEKVYASSVEAYFCEECNENFSHGEILDMITKVIKE